MYSDNSSRQEGVFDDNFSYFSYVVTPHLNRLADSFYAELKKNVPYYYQILPLTAPPHPVCFPSSIKFPKWCELTLGTVALKRLYDLNND